MCCLLILSRKTQCPHSVCRFSDSILSLVRIIRGKPSAHSIKTKHHQPYSSLPKSCIVLNLFQKQGQVALEYWYQASRMPKISCYRLGSKEISVSMHKFARSNWAIWFNLYWVGVEIYNHRPVSEFYKWNDKIQELY